MLIIGIDPGKTGAVAKLFCNIEGVTFASVHDTPYIDDYDEDGMARLLGDEDETHVFLEKVGAMPGQGVVSMFNFGKGYGIWRGILGALYRPRTFVTPQAWKKEMMQGIKDKDAARPRAIQ